MLSGKTLKTNKYKLTKSFQFQKLSLLFTIISNKEDLQTAITNIFEAC